MLNLKVSAFLIPYYSYTKRYHQAKKRKEKREMDFITIDFETATAQRDSPCEIGLTFVENFEIVKSKSWLIKPMYDEFDYFNILIHGIRPEHVADKPEFNELWPEIKPLIENKFLIAHNAGFDFSVLRRTLEAYNLPFPNLEYSCSYIFSKKVWEGLPAYDLKTLCNYNNISLNHHRAEADSRATAELTIKAFKQNGITSKEDFPEKLRTNIGQLFEGGYKPSETKRIYRAKDLAKIVGDPEKHNKESIFYGKTVVFTGALSSMVRSQAQQTIADIGGLNGGGVTKSTDYLVVGQQDYRVVGEDGMSSKQEKAIKYIEQGAEIEILSENEFTRNL
ncbi:MAG: DNA polymerase-3 subunit epsilon [Polaribacter sp.]